MTGARLVTGIEHLREASTVLLGVEHLELTYHTDGGAVQAVSDVSFDLAPGETLGIVGESGCGKSSAARAVLRLVEPTAGTIRYGGQDLRALSVAELRRARTDIQIIFQDPVSALNPRRKVKHLVGEGLSIWRSGTRAQRLERVREAMEAVGLDPDTFGDRRPRELSGGQCQRVCIARALVMNPRIIVCDEPVAALDVSIQAQITNLLEDMKEKFGLSLLFIAHDLAVVRSISDRVAVMYLGKIVEIGPASAVYSSPAHPYTSVLLAAVPEPDPGVPIPHTPAIGDVPSPIDPPSGCRFRTRCPRAEQLCADEEPVLRPYGQKGNFAACHFPSEAVAAIGGRA
ncbi:ABC transporter ATP-binding protein [Pseudonocardia sp. N23]|uniref:ABC transporter ATP-binding protein n=1 Tax=Pseudonocardia sp. N23 TaxID=1987376 RepID=UPI000C038397|nr:oligopeptide/dipeptide ABC transporter ATP-binding protein [Pseudonocardia sp. N23]GAY08708.1 oligopeptide transport ATP-binding protein OppF [Pseudonocardia sp. N23]